MIERGSDFHKIGPREVHSRGGFLGGDVYSVGGEVYSVENEGVVIKVLNRQVLCIQRYL